MKLALAVCLVALAVGGCATMPVPTADAKPVPVSRVYFKAPAAGQATVKVTFVRDAGFVGAAVYQHVYINGERATSLDTGEKWEVRLPPGEHVFGVIPTNIGTRSLRSIDQLLAPGRAYTYRIVTELDAGSRLQRDAVSTAE